MNQRGGGPGPGTAPPPPPSLFPPCVELGVGGCGWWGRGSVRALVGRACGVGGVGLVRAGGGVAPAWLGCGRSGGGRGPRCAGARGWWGGGGGGGGVLGAPAGRAGPGSRRRLRQARDCWWCGRPAVAALAPITRPQMPRARGAAVVASLPDRSRPGGGGRPFLVAAEAPGHDAEVFSAWPRRAVAGLACGRARGVRVTARCSDRRSPGSGRHGRQAVAWPGQPCTRRARPPPAGRPVRVEPRTGRGRAAGRGTVGRAGQRRRCRSADSTSMAAAEAAT